MKKNKENITVRIFYDGNADAKDLFADVIKARTDRAISEKVVEMKPEISYSKGEVCDDSHLALGLCG